MRSTRRGPAALALALGLTTAAFGATAGATPDRSVTSNPSDDDITVEVTAKSGKVKENADGTDRIVLRKLGRYADLAHGDDDDLPVGDGLELLANTDNGFVIGLIHGVGADDETYRVKLTDITVTDGAVSADVEVVDKGGDPLPDGAKGAALPPAAFHNVTLDATLDDPQVPTDPGVEADSTGGGGQPTSPVRATITLTGFDGQSRATLIPSPSRCIINPTSTQFEVGTTPSVHQWTFAVGQGDPCLEMSYTIRVGGVKNDEAIFGFTFQEVTRNTFSVKSRVCSGAQCSVVGGINDLKISMTTR